MSYDGHNNLSAFWEQVGSGRTVYNTTFSYDSAERITAIQYGNTSNKVAYTYDAVGRVKTKTLTAAGSAYTTTYNYTSGGHGTGSSTMLLSAVSQTNESCSYWYDDCGNIRTSSRSGANVAIYTHNRQNELTRINDQRDKTSGSDGTTWTYSYDRGGNMLKKKRAAHTTGTLGEIGA